MKKIYALLLALLMIVSLAACESGGETKVTTAPDTTASEATIPMESGTEPAPTESMPPEKISVHLERDDWADDVKAAVNDLVEMYGVNSEGYDPAKPPYAVFDFDNTCSIFDVEEQLAVYQLEVMAFAFDPAKLPDVLKTELGDLAEDRTDLGYGKGSYQDWIDDITGAYTKLYEKYGPFTPAGLDAEKQKEVQADPQWQEFATKMRAMYDLVYDAESADVAYPWVLYWFTGMTEDEVHALATASHTKYKAVETSEVTWKTPEEIDKTSKVGAVEYTWTSGTQVPANVVELWKVLQANGIDVWVCSASATDPIRAAIDVWDMHQYVTGVLAMTNKLEEGKYINAYDYETGYAWLNQEGKWVKDTANPTKSQTQGVGKVTAVDNAIYVRYGYGPIAGFMDSTGDFNFCTEYKSLKMVICYNRASRKVTDGGGLVAAIAMYQRDDLGYKDLATANAAGDTLYVLQGRDENGMRTLRKSNATLRFGKTEELLFRDENNEAQLKYMKDNKLSTKEYMDMFAKKTGADDEGNVLGFKYGFLKEYAGYHSHD